MRNLEKFKNKLKNNEHITIDFVGDSITHGLNYCAAEETYVAKFAAEMAKKFPEFSVYRYDGIVKDELSPLVGFEGPFLVSAGTGKGRIDIIRNGVGGNTIMRAYNRIHNFTGTLANEKEPDLTFLMFGINDALKSDESKYVTPEKFKENYKMLIDEIRVRNSGTAIVLLSSTYNGFGIKDHCEKSMELAKEENIPYIDMFKFWCDHYDENADNYGQGEWLFGNGDSCHPMPIGAELTAKHIFNEFMKLI